MDPHNIQEALMAQYRVDETGKRELVHATQPAGSKPAEQVKPATKRAPTTPATPGEAPKE